MPPGAQHAERDVRSDHERAGPCQLLGRHAGTGAEVQAALAGAEIQGGAGGPAPDPVTAEGQDRVGQVVPFGHPVEHRGDLVRLLVQVGAGHRAHSNP